MKANIRIREGTKEVEILKEPFVVKGVRLFVHCEKNMGTYFVISEWQTGFGFTSADTKEEIKPRIKRVFSRIGVERVKRTIEEAVKEHGIVNEGQGVEEKN